MKKLLLLLPALLLFSLYSFGQPPKAVSFDSNNSHYTLGQLDELGKLELTTIYVEMVQKLNLLLPYTAFNQKGEASALSSMGIPNTKDNNGAIKQLDASGVSNNVVISETMASILPYADKENIVKGILFIQGVLENLERGL